MNKSDKITVAITGMNSLPENPASGVPVMRCLRRAFGKRIRIIGLGYDAFDAGLHIDNGCDAAYLLPYPRVGAEPFFYRLKEIQEIEHINLLLPCLDAELFLIVNLAKRLANIGITTFLPTEHDLSRCAKNRLHELAKIVGIPYPETKSLLSTDFFDTSFLDGWEYPLVVKGPFYDARVVSTPAAGIEAFNEISYDWGVPILVQRYIEGEEYNLTAIGDGTGEMRGEVMMKKVAITSKNKAFVGVTMHDDVLKIAAKKLIKELQWRGPFELEVMRDADGTYHLIEINPRFPAWISLSDGVGRNLPARLVELALGKKLKPFAAVNTGTYFVRYPEEQIVSLEEIESIVIQGCSIVK